MSDSDDRSTVNRPRWPLLPSNPALGWTPYAWLIYLVTLFVQPIVRHAGAIEWALTIVGTVVFLGSYFRGFWAESDARRLTIAIFQFALGLAFTPINSGAAVLFVYSAGQAARLDKPRRALRAIVAVTLVGTAVGVLTNQPVYYLVLAFVVAPLIGAVNMHQSTVARTSAGLRAAHDEIRHLAAVAERERIARDLHDVLGHTLSLIVLKSELASKLANVDTARAIDKIRDVERVARASLEEVRATVCGYRPLLPEEVERARSMLETAAIASRIEIPEIALSRAQEEALAFAVREAITNVVRHSGAHSATIRLAAVDDAYLLEIRDDGSGAECAQCDGAHEPRKRDSLGRHLQRADHRRARAAGAARRENARGFGRAAAAAQSIDLRGRRHHRAVRRDQSDRLDPHRPRPRVKEGSPCFVNCVPL
jgi:two-component system sensor histidine kinase DesK